MISLIQKAEKGDTSVLPQLRKLLCNTPLLWKQYGDLAKWAEDAWLRLICGGNLTLKESMLLKLAELKHELGASASLLESLLAQRVMISWLEINYADANLAQMKEQNAGSEHLRVARRLQDRAQVRHLSAIRALAQHRKLIRPPLSPIDLVSLPLRESRPANTYQGRNSRFAGVSMAGGN